MNIRQRTRRATGLKEYLAAQEKNSLLRFPDSGGSVDDGKSTLIGRLLYDTKLLFEDTLSASWKRISKKSSAPPAKTSISRCW